MSVHILYECKGQHVNGEKVNLKVFIQKKKNYMIWYDMTFQNMNLKLKLKQCIYTYLRSKIIYNFQPLSLLSRARKITNLFFWINLPLIRGKQILKNVAKYINKKLYSCIYNTNKLELKHKQRISGCWKIVFLSKDKSVQHSEERTFWRKYYCLSSQEQEKWPNYFLG